jgi:UDPglucose 6-dehydrogenase
MPEFLRERTWQLDFRETKQWIIGVCQNKSFVNQDAIFGARIVKLLGHAVRDYQIAGNEIYWATTDETELAKYTRNAFLATKLSFFNEIESFASASNIDYSIVRELVGIDERIGMGHTQVPGADKQRGFGGTCFPKDIAALQTEMTKVNVKSPIIDAVIKRNNEIDRPDKKWEVGRTVV